MNREVKGVLDNSSGYPITNFSVLGPHGRQLPRSPGPRRWVQSRAEQLQQWLGGLIKPGDTAHDLRRPRIRRERCCRGRSRGRAAFACRGRRSRHSGGSSPSRSANLAGQADRVLSVGQLEQRLSIMYVTVAQALAVRSDLCCRRWRSPPVTGQELDASRYEVPPAGCGGRELTLCCIPVSAGKRMRPDGLDPGWLAAVGRPGSAQPGRRLKRPPAVAPSKPLPALTLGTQASASGGGGGHRVCCP